MQLKDMKKNIPETPEFIHTMIQMEVKKQLENTKVINIQERRIKKWTSAKVTAALVVGILVTSTMVYAGSKLYHMIIEKQGTYSITTGIKADNVTGELNLPDKIHDIDISLEYIPDGMKWIDETHLEYPDHNRTGGFSFESVLLDENDLSKVLQDKNVVDYEVRDFGKYEGVYLKYNDLAENGSFNQRIYLFCPDLYRVFTIYIGDDVSQEDAMKVIEKLVITEKDTMIETAGLNTWSEKISREKSSEESMLITDIAEDKLPIYQIGEVFDMEANGEDRNGNYIEDCKISVCVDSVQIKDDLQLFNQNNMPKEWIGAVGSDGKLVKNNLSYIKAGNGIDSVDEIVKTKSVNQKLVYTTVTYTNKSDKEINHMLYLGTLMLMNHENGAYEIYHPTDQSGAGYDRVMWDGVAKASEMTYCSILEDYGNGGNYISSLKPGESVQVNMAWIVNENDLEHMYLNFNTEGGAYEFLDSTLKLGVVNICQ